MLNYFLKRINNKKGFTLVELVVVIAILGILAAIAIPRFTTQTQGAKEVADKASARNIVAAINMAVADGTWEIATDQVQETGTTTAVNLPDDLKPTYMDEVPKSQLSSDGTFTVTVAESAIVIKAGEYQVYPIND